MRSDIKFKTESAPGSRNKHTHTHHHDHSARIFNFKFNCELGRPKKKKKKKKNKCPQICEGNRRRPYVYRRLVTIAVEYQNTDIDLDLGINRPRSTMICPSQGQMFNIIYKYNTVQTTMYVMIFVFVDLLFVTDTICATVFKVELLEMGTSGTIPCDLLKNESEIRVVQWYKSRRSDEFVNGDDSLAWWTDGVTGSLPNYHLESNTFALVFEEATLDDEGLYKCSVERGDLFTESNYYTHMFLYALPRVNPKIKLDTDLNHVNCTVEHVKPVIYPVFNFDWSPDSTETYAVLNEDGTYTTSVCCALPRTKSASRVDCSFSYLHYQEVGSLYFLDITTDSLIEHTATSVSPMGPFVTFADDGCRTIDQTANLVEKMFLGLLVVTNFITLIMLINLWRKYQTMQNWMRTNGSEGEKLQPAMAVKASAACDA